jgi:tRNA-Thr(GGU) m(6)t(6)A37 methyltransferase TsaA
MIDKAFHFAPIGKLQTPYTDIQDMPIQPTGSSGIIGTMILDPAYIDGIKDLDGFSHIILIYVFHQASEPRMTVIPFHDKEPHGVFATRAPNRPNPIGLSIVRLIEIHENILTLENVDMLDGAPVIDIKPYVPSFDHPENVKMGWLEPRNNEVKTKLADDRFR